MTIKINPGLNLGLNLTHLARCIKFLIGGLNCQKNMADLLFQNIVPAQQRRPRTFRLNNNLLNYTDEELRARYRFGRVSLNYILNLIEEDLTRPTNRNHALDPLTQLLVALRFFASGNFL